jgi:hypothetical protein
MGGGYTRGSGGVRWPGGEGEKVAARRWRRCCVCRQPWAVPSLQLDIGSFDSISFIYKILSLV